MVAIGYKALYYNQSPVNTAIGRQASFKNVLGVHNISIGDSALYFNSSGNFNIAIGDNSLQNSNTNYNIAIGFEVLGFGDSGPTGGNIAIGYKTLYENSAGNLVAIGTSALHKKIQPENII